MKKIFLSLLLIFLIPFYARAILLFSDGFEGSYFDDYSSSAHEECNGGATGFEINTVENGCSSDPCLDWARDMNRNSSVKKSGSYSMASRDSICNRVEMQYSLDNNSSNEIWISYWFYFASGYNWPSINQKFFYLSYPNVSLNFQWNPGSGGSNPILRVYDLTGNCATDPIYVTSGWDIPSNTNQWNQVKIYVKSNTPGSSDGIVKVWVRWGPTGEWNEMDWYIGETPVDNTAMSWACSGQTMGAAGSLQVRDYRSLVQGDYGDVYFDDLLVGTTQSDVDSEASDTTPPVTTGHDPAKSATNVEESTDIVVIVYDEANDVDLDTIVLTEESNAHTCIGAATGDKVLTCADYSALGNGYTVTYDPPTDYSYDQEINVTLDADDTEANSMTQDSWSFTIKSEPVPFPNTSIGAGSQISLSGSGNMTLQ